jgi:hypothetical protein
VACVLDSAVAAQELVALGADPNYSHEDGDSPLLHASDQGYLDCLRAVLPRSPINALLSTMDRLIAEVEGGNRPVDLGVATRDGKTVLGQGLLVYSAGGDTALHLAVRGAHVGCVALLADVLLASGETHLLKQPNSFGVTPLALALEQLGVASEGSRADRVACAQTLSAALGVRLDRCPVPDAVRVLQWTRHARSRQ